MIGLLYKEYAVNCRTKRYNAFILILFISAAFILARMAVPSSAFENMADYWFAVAYFLLVAFSLAFVSMLVIKTGGGDRESKARGYVLAMPISGKTYIASKYVFVILAVGVMILLQYLLGRVCAANCAAGLLKEFCKTVNSGIMFFAAVYLVFAAIDLPLCLFLGKEKTVLIGVAILITLLMGFMAFLFFGDLKKIIGFNLQNILLWFARHKDEISLAKKLVPLGALVLYVISFGLSGLLIEKTEQ